MTEPWGATAALFQDEKPDSSTAGKGIRSFTIKTADGETLETWELLVPESREVAIIFHGNGGNLSNFQRYQRFFEEQGISSYGLDYRGYGNSTGWPSEKGLYADASALFNFVKERTGVADSKLIIVGISIGTGPAAYLSKKVQPGLTILFAPYVSLPKLIAAKKYLWIFSPFSWYSFPVADYVKSLSSTCLIVLHGRRDSVIPFEQGVAVKSGYAGQSPVVFLEHENAGHNDLLYHLGDDLGKNITRFRKGTCGGGEAENP